ncbi:Palmitoylated plasma membrane-bound casein kinase [Fusarium solani]|nr:Palmitoylated plasma membrane-bound casein kinase [Fusarium solani]
MGSGEMDSPDWDWSKLEAEEASKGNLIQEDQDQPGYQVGKRTGKGTFGVVYEGVNLSSGRPVAIKFEPLHPKVPQLRDEYRVYKKLAGCHGIPNVHYFGRHYLNNILVLGLLGTNLEDLFEICGQRFTIKTIVGVGKQMISRLESLHENNYIHRDIKPENFLTGGLDATDKIFLIDLAMAKEYLDRKSNEHISYKEGRSLVGTPRYMSINTHLGREQSRRDDLEALAYVLIYFLKGRLPWQGITDADKKRRYELIGKKKQAITVEELCEGCPTQVSTFLRHVRGLGFMDPPDYGHLRDLLSQALKDSREVDNGRYDWDEKAGEKVITSSPNAYEAANIGSKTRAPQTLKREMTLLGPEHFPRPLKKRSYETISAAAADNDHWKR